jgi:hypothetical protein
MIRLTSDLAENSWAILLVFTIFFRPRSLFRGALCRNLPGRIAHSRATVPARLISPGHFYLYLFIWIYTFISVAPAQLAVHPTKQQQQQ